MISNETQQTPRTPQTPMNVQDGGSVETRLRGVNKETEIFRKSSKIARSPPGKALQTPTRSYDQNISRAHGHWPVNEAAKCNEVDSTPYRNSDAIIVQQLSPKEELISAARIAEEQCLRKCRAVLDKMRAAFAKQKNISMDIKTGVSELDELLDVVENHRRSWKIAESEQKARNKSHVLPANRGKEVNQVTSDAAIISKRAASSPAKDGTTKKHKVDDLNGEWQTVTKKKNKNREDQTPKAKSSEGSKLPRIKHRTDAVLIKPKEGHSYAEVLKNLRSKVNPEEVNIKIKAIRKTKDGAILLELDRGEKIDNKLTDAIKSTLLDTAETTKLTPRTVIQILDLDTCTTCEEVSEAIRVLLNNPEADLKVTISGPNQREQKKATVNISNEYVSKLMGNNRIKIGLVYCRMRVYSGVMRCFKCLDSGHNQWECKGPDRRNVCIRCGRTGHKIKECKNRPNCCLCVAKGLNQIEHIPGSGKCLANTNQGI